MGAGKKAETFLLNTMVSSSPKQPTHAAVARNLGKANLGGVIFGCKKNTMKECLFKQLFGLPAQHFSYVQNVTPGLPLFLFNYTDRKLYGIFEAASSGQMNINPYAWTLDGNERTLYPAQVQVRIKLQCQPLSEEEFKPIISDNYYTPQHFWFELDHAQTNRLISKLSTMALAPGSLARGANIWASAFQTLPSKKVEISCGPNTSAPEPSAPLDRQDMLNKSPVDDPLADREAKDLIYLQLKELALNRKSIDASVRGHATEFSTYINKTSGEEASLPEQTIPEENEKISGSSLDLLDHPSVISQLLQEIQELKAFKEEQIQRTDHVQKKLQEAEEEICQLKHRCMLLESVSYPSLVQADSGGIESLDNWHLDFDESIFLIGGYDGFSWLSALNLYSPSQDVLTARKPMSCARSYSSVVKLNGELYVFGGGNGSLWYDTVESYNPVDNQWRLHPSLNERKGSLAGAALGNKIFALGGGNGLECFSNVEMYDVDIGRWIATQSMLQKRFALAAAELNGAIYAVGGYDGIVYLKSAERFDPREHSWSRIDGMNTKRGCHSLVVMNEKLYAIGGYDDSSMSPSLEIYDPRLGKWMAGEPMNQPRGYLAAAVLKESIYAIGGVKSSEDILDTVECYKEGEGWQLTNLKAVGRRCFSSAIVLGQD